MNNKLLINYLVLVISVFFACSGPVKKENEKNASESSLSLHAGDEKYHLIDTKQSFLTWTGSALVGTNSHTGYVYVSKGELMIDNDQLLGGTVEINMNTIEDQSHQSNNGLIQHLKNPDFFDVQKFPFSTIVITGVESINGADKKITGDLTIKGITNQVTFPAKVEVKDGTVKANGKLTIDRTKWDIRYKSKKIYDILANQAISDSIEFDIKIVAKQ